MRFSFDTGSFEVGRYRGAPVVLSPTFFITAVVLVIPFLRMLSLRGIVLAGFFIAMFFLSILIHELAHAVTATRYRVEVARIEIDMAGGIVQFRGWPRTIGQDLLITLAGPIANLVLGLGALLLAKLMPVPEMVMLNGKLIPSFSRRRFSSPRWSWPFRFFACSACAGLCSRGSSSRCSFSPS